MRAKKTTPRLAFLSAAALQEMISKELLDELHAPHPSSIRVEKKVFRWEIPAEAVATALRNMKKTHIQLFALFSYFPPLCSPTCPLCSRASVFRRPNRMASGGRLNYDRSFFFLSSLLSFPSTSLVLLLQQRQHSTYTRAFWKMGKTNYSVSQVWILTDCISKREGGVKKKYKEKENLVTDPFQLGKPCESGSRLVIYTTAPGKRRILVKGEKERKKGKSDRSRAEFA